MPSGRRGIHTLRQPKEITKRINSKAESDFVFIVETVAQIVIKFPFRLTFGVIRQIVVFFVNVCGIRYVFVINIIFKKNNLLRLFY